MTVLHSKEVPNALTCTCQAAGVTLYCCGVVKLVIAVIDVACLMLCHLLAIFLIKTGLQERSARSKNPAVDRRRGCAFEKKNAAHCAILHLPEKVSPYNTSYCRMHLVQAKAACVVWLLS